jgi:hypothetical protein
VLGSGLRASSMTLVLTASVLVFVFWGGPLWNAPSGSSHIPRIVISYLMVIPIAAAILTVTRRWHWVRLVSSTALLWSAKLLITASLYSLLATGSGNRYEPVATASASTRAVSTAPLGYRPAAQPGPVGRISGIIRYRGTPIAGAVVFLEAPPPGLALEAAHEVGIAVDGASREKTLVATTHDRVFATHDDARLHTVRLTRDGQATANVPLTPSARSTELPASEPGNYEWACALHADERGTLVVVDHPYAAVSDGAGRFVLAGVAAGEVQLAVVRHGDAPARRRIRTLGADVKTTIEIEEVE